MAQFASFDVTSRRTCSERGTASSAADLERQRAVLQASIRSSSNCAPPLCITHDASGIRFEGHSSAGHDGLLTRFVGSCLDLRNDPLGQLALV
mmetsp:Transcript_54684/g.46049  ORF Transcript_54684/g.46049 Transcript_54684/m.46049 type:complete len:93 (+) Transcript_54684:408-686(+)